MYENVVKECEICQKTRPAPPRSRFSGVRAKEFGDVVFMDHCEIKHMTKKHQLFSCPGWRDEPSVGSYPTRRHRASNTGSVQRVDACSFV